MLSSLKKKNLRQVTDSSAPVAGTGIADGAKTDGSALPTTDTATLASTGIADTKTDGSSVALAGTGGIGDAKTESAPHAATGADNTKKALIDRISTRFVTNKRCAYFLHLHSTCSMQRKYMYIT